MPEWVKIGSAADVAPGKGKTFEASGRLVAVFNVDGAFHAIDNTCLHRGGPLGEGELAGTTVTCPWHGWQYNVCTGRGVLSESIQLRCYPLEKRGEELYVDIGG